MIKVAFDPIYAHPLPENHRFPMLKYDLIPQQLQYEGTYSPEQFFSPKPCKKNVILQTHDSEYFEKLINQQLSQREQRVVGFPQSQELIQRELIITQGTIDNCMYALDHKISLNVAGGTHHAFTNRGEGFCLLNDMATAANWLLKKKYSKKILIVDLDVHQGNGTAQIMKDNDHVFTFSMHGANNYPARKEISDLDIGLKDGISGEEYLSILMDTLPKLLVNVKPDFVFYLAGVDILETDKLGKLNVSMEDCKRRDEFVLGQMKKQNLPVTIALGGGYSPSIKTIVEAHCNTFRIASALF